MKNGFQKSSSTTADMEFKPVERELESKMKDRFLAQYETVEKVLKILRNVKVDIYTKQLAQK